MQTMVQEKQLKPGLTYWPVPDPTKVVDQVTRDQKTRF